MLCSGAEERAFGDNYPKREKRNEIQWATAEKVNIRISIYLCEKEFSKGIRGEEFQDDRNKIKPKEECSLPILRLFLQQETLKGM